MRVYMNDPELNEMLRMVTIKRYIACRMTRQVPEDVYWRIIDGDVLEVGDIDYLPFVHNIISRHIQAEELNLDLLELESIKNETAPRGWDNANDVETLRLLERSQQNIREAYEVLNMGIDNTWA